MITSNNNAKVKQVVQWQTKAKERRKDHVFLAEGVRMCEEAPVKNVREVYLTEEPAECPERRHSILGQIAADRLRDRIPGSLCQNGGYPDPPGHSDSAGTAGL